MQNPTSLPPYTAFQSTNRRFLPPPGPQTQGMPIPQPDAFQRHANQLRMGQPNAGPQNAEEELNQALAKPGLPIFDISNARIKARNPQEAEYINFIWRMQAINRSEVAETNFGKPNNLHDNPFADYWQGLDRQHQILHDHIQAFRRANRGTNGNDYLQAYENHYQAAAQAGQAGHMETPQSLRNRVLWLNKMINKRNGPPEPLTGLWDLLSPSQQNLLNRVTQRMNPGTTDQDYIQSYSQEYLDAARPGRISNLEHPDEIEKQLKWVTGLINFINDLYRHPRV